VLSVNIIWRLRCGCRPI